MGEIGWFCSSSSSSVVLRLGRNICMVIREGRYVSYGGLPLSFRSSRGCYPLLCLFYRISFGGCIEVS